MNYPVWDVPIIGGGWVIGIIAIIHVMISHFAVGGGLYLPMTERKALRAGRRDWLETLRGHSKFFLILTGIFGTVTGVGIWFAIGLASPDGTSALIHNFVLIWATEWAFFIMELSSIAVYYYTWNRISDRLHLMVGWFYAVTSVFTLIIIVGILGFMLSPGAAWLSVAGTGQEATMFWQGYFNPTFLPMMCIRVLICVMLAGLWALVTASRIDGVKHPILKTEVVRWAAKWVMPAFVLLPVGYVWYLSMVPDAQRVLLTLGIPTSGPGIFTQVTRSALLPVIGSASISLVVYLFAWRNPRDFGLSAAISILLIGLLIVGGSEHVREMLRKPYVVGQYMYSNGVRVIDVPRFNEKGYLAQSLWGRDGDMDGTPSERGEWMFRGQCMACHTVDGYRSMRALLQQRDRKAIASVLKLLHDQPEDSPYRKFMPPLVGTQQEIDCLAEYLDVLAHPAPSETTAPQGG